MPFPKRWQTSFERRNAMNEGDSTMPEFNYLKILGGYICGVAIMEGVTYEEAAEAFLTPEEYQELKRICNKVVPKKAE